MYLTGNTAVDAMGKINISGNITPHIWFQTILKPSAGKPYLLAIAILSDIVYWYRPAEIRDESTGQLVGWKKKFRGDSLQKTYQNYADMFGESKRTIKEAMDVLCDRGVIEREFKKINMGSGVVANNVMFIRLCVDVLYDLTFPNIQNGSEVHVIGIEEMEGDLLRKSSIGYGENPREGMEEIRNRSPRKSEVGTAKNRSTNTEISTETTSESTPPSSGKGEAGDYRQLIRENIKLDDLYTVFGNGNELVTEIYELMCEIVTVPRNRIRISGEEYPYEIVKSRMLKLGIDHVQYVIDVISNTTEKIQNIKGYLTTVLFNSLTSVDTYYTNLVKHNYAYQN